MRSMETATWMALVTLGIFGTSACSSSSPGPTNKPPVIDNLDMPATAAGAAGSYSVKGVLAFHDDDGTVTKVRVHVPPSADKDLDVPSLQRYDGDVEVTLQGPGVISGASISYEISVVDNLGTESGKVRRSVTIP